MPPIRDRHRTDSRSTGPSRTATPPAPSTPGPVLAVSPTAPRPLALSSNFLFGPTSSDTEVSDGSETEDEEPFVMETRPQSAAGHRQQTNSRHSEPQRISPAPRIARPPPASNEVVVISSDEEDEEEDEEPHVGSVQGIWPPRRGQTQLMELDQQPSRGRTSDGFLVSRIVRSNPIEITEDQPAGPSSAVTPRTATPQGDNTPLQPPRPQRTPPKGKPPAVIHPLLSKYTCPICLCTPSPHVVATPCGHLFCSECLFEALQVPAKSKQTEIREQAAAFASFAAIRTGAYPPFLAGFLGGTPIAPNESAEEAAAAMELAVAQGGEESSTGVRPGQAAQQSRGRQSRTRNAATSSSREAPPAKVDPLIGVCPVCRSTIPGGFMAYNGLPASKRTVFGLELKIGKPIDDPRG